MIRATSVAILSLILTGYSAADGFSSKRTVSKDYLSHCFLINSPLGLSILQEGREIVDSQSNDPKLHNAETRRIARVFSENFLDTAADELDDATDDQIELLKDYCDMRMSAEFAFVKNLERKVIKAGELAQASRE